MEDGGFVWRRRESRWEEAASAPQKRERARKRKETVERRRRKGASLPGDERYFELTLNNRISPGAAMYFGT